MTKKIENLILIYGLSIICSSFSTLLVTFVGFLLHFPITKWDFWIVVALTLVFVVTSVKLLVPGKLMLNSLMLFSALIFSFTISVLINRQFYDLAYDGLAYHGEGILQLVNGYNPLYERVSAFHHIHDIWINSYPKLSWYQSAVYYKVFENFAEVKFFSFLLIFASFAVALAFLGHLKFLNMGWKLRLASLLAVTPITLNQAISLNLDGQISSLMLILFSLFGLIIIKFKEERASLIERWYYTIATGMTFVVLSNTKTTGLIYGIFFLFGFCLYLITLKLKGTMLFLKMIPVFIILTFTLGFNPFITNIVYHGNPLYPQIGGGINVSENTPSNYLGASNLKIFASSIFFKSDNIFSAVDGDKAEIKTPFSISDSEIQAIRVASSLKKGGFGPLFSGGFVLFVLALLIALYYFLAGSYSAKMQEFRTGNQLKSAFNTLFKMQTLLYVGIVALASFLLSNASNTYRFIPHFWFVIPIGILYFLSLKKSSLNIFSYVIYTILLFNVALMGLIHFSGQYQLSSIMNAKLNILSSTTQPLTVNFNRHTAFRQILIERGINWVDTFESETPMCIQNTSLFNIFPLNETGLCLNNYLPREQQLLLGNGLGN